MAKKYSVSLAQGENVARSTGSTIFKALGNLKPTVLKTRALLTVTSGERKFIKMFYPIQVKRMLANHTYRAILDKQLATMLK